MSGTAGLSFQIDASQAGPAADQLNRLSDAADHVRASTRFLVGSVSDTNEALQQLGSNGRASLASFVQISENLDLVTQRLTALRNAAADTIGTMGGQGLGQALTNFQQQFSAMATVFGASTAQLESFNKQAEYLNLNSYQVASALQRITQAQQNMTPYGEALRQGLNQEGINVGQDPAAILRQIQQYFAGHQNSQLAYNTLQEFLGPVDPGTAAAFRYQPYQTVAARRQEFVSQTLDQQGAQTADLTAQLSYQNKYNADAYKDGKPYLSDVTLLDRSDNQRQAFLTEIQRRLAQDKTSNPDNAAQEQRLLDILNGAQAGSQNAIAAESQFDILNPTDSLAKATMSIYGRSTLDGAPISGVPGWYERLTDQNFRDENKNYIAAAYDARRANTNPGAFGIKGAIDDFALNTDEETDLIANRFGLYTGPSDTVNEEQDASQRGRGGVRYRTAGGLSGLIGDVPDAPTIKQLQEGANESEQQKQADAQFAGQLGYGGFTEALNAGVAATNLSAGGINSDRSMLERVFAGTKYGAAAGDNILDQQIAEQNFIAGNAGTLGFDQLQATRAQGFQAGTPYGQDITGAFLQFYRQQGLDPGRLMTGGPGNTPLNMQDILEGQGGAGVALTPAQIASFQQIAGTLTSNATLAQQTGFAQQSASLTTQLGVASASTSQGGYENQLAGVQAYQDVLKKTGDAAQALAAYQDAVTLSMKNQEIQAELTTKALSEQNSQMQAMISATAASGLSGSAGDYSRNQFQTGIEKALFQYQQNDPKATPQQVEEQRAQLVDQASLRSVQDAQARAGTLSIQATSAQSSLTAVAAGGGFHDQNVASVLADNFQALTTATSKNVDAIDQAVEKQIEYKDSISEATTAMNALVEGFSGLRNANIYQTAMTLPADQRAQFIAGAQAYGSVMAQGDPAYGTPFQGQASASSGVAPAGQTVTGYLAGNLHPAGQPNVVGVDRQGSALFDNHQDAEKAMANQVGLNYSRGDTSIASMMTAWVPPTAPGNSPKITQDAINNVLSFLKMPAGSGNAAYDFSDPQKMQSFLAALQRSEGASNGPLSGAASVAAAGAQEGMVSQGEYEAYNQEGAAQSQIAYSRANILSLLRRGQSGAAQLASAGFVDPNTPAGAQPYVLQSQMDRVADSLEKAAASMEGETTNRLSDAQTLASAATAGPGAVQQAQAGIQAAQIGRQDNLSPEDVKNLTSQLVKTSQAEFQQQYGGQIYQGGLNNVARAQTIYNDNTIADPYQRTIADAQVAQNKQDTLAKQQGATPAQIAISDNFSQWAAQLDVIAQKSQVVAQGMSQIGSAVSDTAQNLAFSYQHGPGAGLFARQQVSGLLNTGARSLFNTVIGTPIDNFVSGNLTSAVNTLMGNNPGSANNGSGSGGNGTGSAAGQALNSVGGMIGNQASNMLLSNAVKGIGSWLGIGGTGTFGNGNGGIGGFADEMGATPNSVASPGIMSSIGSGLSSAASGIEGFFGSLFGSFANGGVFSGGQRVMFANGGVFGPPAGGLRRMFAAGDVFNDPTTMPMAMLGEAGPEAIMPLRRGADGKLGIATSGGGGGPSIQVNAPITIGANALGPTGKMSARQQQDLQRQLHDTITRSVKSVMVDQSRPGGMIQPQQG